MDKSKCIICGEKEEMLYTCTTCTATYCEDCKQEHTRETDEEGGELESDITED